MTDQRKGIQSIEQGVKVLEALINSRRAQPLKLIASAAGMSPSMTHRYLSSFVRVGLAQQDSGTGFYDLGTFALRLGIAAINRADLFKVIDDEFRQLVDRVNIDGHVTIWGDYGVTTVRVYNRHAPILSNLRLGTILSLYDSASGRIFLAFQRRQEIQFVLDSELAEMEGGKPTKQEITAVADKVKKDRFAWIDGQVLRSFRAIAVPIFDSQDNLCAAMALVSNQPSLVSFPNKMLEDLLDTSKRTSKRLGWSDR